MKKTYLKKVKEVAQNTSQRIASLSNFDSKERLNFLLFKSAIKFLYPAIEPTIDVYNQYLLNRELSNLEINYVHLLEKNGFSKMQGKENLNHNAIYCSFHMGSYISISYYLVQNNIDFSIVIGADGFDEKEKMFIDSYEKALKVLGNSTSKMDIINGQSRNAIISMVKKIKKGHSLLFYIDGSKGLKEFTPDDDNLIKINFFESQLFSRKGISFLSHYLKIPIIPVLSCRIKNNEIKVIFKTAIYPEGERKTYCSFATQEIWNIFSEHFKQFPMQWESIYFMHQFKVYSTTGEVHRLNKNETYVFNADRYDFFSIKQSKAVFDNYNGKSIQLPDGYLNFLYKLYSKNIELEGQDIEKIIKNKESINTLFSNEFLVNNKVAI
jgi:lauroyl/myristoyl acyltransferase